ncbi:MAG: hypothetical protein HGA45_18455 [Chloroflexales bacterium]|nr:hypothetical protein [Chloroflexales bacterium]
MPDIIELVDPDTLEQPAPRRLPIFFVPNLIGEYLLERPLTVYLDPFVILCVIAAAALAALGVPPLAGLALVALVGVRLLGPCLRLYHNVREDYHLLRHGLVINAHVIGLRPCRSASGRPAGAYLDCAIPITRQRTSVGSVWLPDTSEAVRLSAAGRIPVICLAHAPGTWRLRHGDGPHLRYDPAKA